VTFTGAAANIVFDKSDNALEFADNAKAVFGTGGDLEISHNGSNSIINDAGTGDLLLQLGGSTKFSLNSSGAEVHGDIIIADKIIHDGDTNTAIRFPAADTVAVETGGSERIRVNDTGLGIGITPAGQLHVSSGTSGDCELIIESDTDNNEENDNPRIVFKQDGGSDQSAIGLGNNALELSNSVSNGGIVFKTGTTSGYTNAVTRMTIDGSGNCGIGIESADTKLHVHKGSAGTVSADSNAVLALENSTHCVLNIMTPANKSAYIMMGDPDDINAGQIRYDNNTDQLLIDVNGSERARILSDGSFCVGDTAAGARLHVKGSGNGSGASALRVENSDNTELFEIRNDGAVFTGDDGGSPINFTGGSANVHIDSNGRLKTVSSSKKYKQDIKDALWGLAEVLKLRPVTFKYKTQGEDEKDKKYAGFTAEEVHNLGLTDFVDYRNNRPDSINYPNMVALMAKAIQELNAKVAVLEAS